MKITIAEIAKMAGVSKTTVSRVINGKSDVLPSTRDRINELIRIYDFHPNAYAKAITKSKSNTIGLVITQSANYVFSNPYYAEIIRGVSNEAQSRGYHLMLTYSAGEDYIEVVRQKRVDGVILLSPTAGHLPVIRQLEEMEMPFVSSSRMPGRPDIHHVCTDDILAAEMAIRHLTDLGHRRIGFINGPFALASSEDRMVGYFRTLESAGFEARREWVREGDTSVFSGRRAMAELIRETDVTAVFTASDLMAIGAIQAVQEAGKRVPEDYSIIGFDDIPLAEFLNPPLTTIHQDTFEKGRIATRKLVDLLEGRTVDTTCHIPFSLVIRQSTRAI